MENAVNVHVIVEITDSEHKKLTFHQREVAVHQIKEAAGLPLDTELALKREGELDRLANSEKLTLREGERFLVIHKDFLLIVNGKEKVWHEKHISYRQVVELYFGPDAFKNPNTIYEVKYSHGPEKNPKGSMVDGDTVLVKSGMVFNATPTGRS